MKTPEEIKSAVLKECMGLEYKPIRGYDIATTDIPALGVRKWSHQRQDKFILGFMDGFGDFNGGSLVFYDALSASDPNWQLAYRLLNLEAKEIQERAKGLVDALVDAEMAIDHARTICPSPKRRYFSTAIIKVGTALNQWKGVQHV